VLDGELDAVVMAAGAGTRLRPLTERYAKAVLPIDGVPVIAALLRELAGAGCTRVTMVVGHLGGQVRSLLGDGPGFGAQIVYAEQPSADGSADAVARALAAGARVPCLVAGADTRFSRGDLAAFAEAATGHAGAIAVRRDPAPSPPHRAAVRIEDGHVVRVLDDDPDNPLAAAPLWAIGAALRPFLEGLDGPPFELAQAFQRAVDAGERIQGVEIGPTRDLTRPLDLVVENFTYLKGLPSK
jgi:bifunctional UDP-N-acetylglucosamine pyrophosphorylase/glucosamine-1-phosphate N-acetyltransferase